jgi:dihydroorotate dehydrogenase (NAD+) catalytic subunit
VCETEAGMINAIGLQNPGIEYFIENDLPFLKKYDTAIILNVGASTIEEYVEVCRIANTIDIDGLELNLSCPNVSQGCMACGTTYDGVKEVVSAVRKVLDKPLIVKLTPNITDITIPAKAAEDAGADAISAINTVLAMKIDINTRKPFIANNMGGLSGPAIKPIGVRMVYQIANVVHIPIMGLGGIMNADDAIEYMIAGASIVSIGTANFVNPRVSVEIVDGIESYMKRQNINNITDIIKTVELY